MVSVYLDCLIDHGNKSRLGDNVKKQKPIQALESAWLELTERQTHEATVQVGKDGSTGEQRRGPGKAGGGGTWGVKEAGPAQATSS